MKHLKLISACLLTAIFSIGQVWGELVNSYTKVLSVDQLSNGDIVVIAQETSNAPSVGVTGGTIQSSTSAKKDATVSGTESEWLQFTVIEATNGWYLSDGTNFVGKPTANTFYLTTAENCKGVCSVDEDGVLACNSRYLSQNGSNYRMYTSVGSYTPFYVWKVGSSSTPALSVSPETVDFGTVEQGANVSDKKVTVSFANLTGSVSYSELSGAFTASGSISNTGDKITITPSTATIGEYSQTLTVQSTADSKSAEVTVKMNVVAPFEGETLDIAKENFTSGGYAENNGDHTLGGCIVVNTNQVYQSASSIQFQKTNGYIYNKTNLGTIAKIEITKASGKANNLDVFEGDEQEPSTAVEGSVSGDVTTYTFSANKGYFKLKCNSTGTTNLSLIKIYYTPSANAVTLSCGSNGSLSATVDAVAIASGDNVEMCKTVTITATPNAGYKLKSLTVTDEDDDEVEVTSNQFVMPAKAVTIAATFEANKTLTGITLSGEYPTVFLTGDAFSHEGMTVTADYDDDTHANVTASATFTGYDMSSVSEQTVTVSYTEGTTETQTYSITVKDAYTVTEILPLVPATGTLATRVKGYISHIDEISTEHGNATYYISADGSRTNELQAYRGKNVGNTNFANENDIEVGDFVTVTGDVKTFGTTKEFDQGNYIVSRTAKGAVTSVVVSGTATKTTYSANETFETAGLVVTASYENGFSGVVTEGITWGDDLTDHKVTASGNVAVTATVGGKTSASYDVAVTVAAKTLVSIAATPASYTIYTGEVLPEPTITATFSEGEPEDVSAFAIYDTENVFNTATIDDPDPQTITVSYTFGGETKTTTYTVSVKDYANDIDHPYTPEQARYITINAVGSTKATKDIYVQGIVSQLGGNISSGKWGYYISADGTTTNQFQIYNGYYLDGANFTNATKLHLNDEVIVKGKVIYFNSTTPEFATGESQLESLARTPNFEITDVTALEVGAADLAVADLTIAAEGEGAVTFASSDNTDAVTIVDGKLHAVAAGTATITANLAADGIYKAATTEFDVTVIAAQVKYTITFDGNGSDGGSAPTAIADKAAGVSVTLPANTYTKTGYSFDGWKVFYVDGESVEHVVAVSEGVFTMPAFDVTIQAQWADAPYWATVYTSNVTLTAGTNAQNSKIRFTAEGTQYDAVKAGTGKAGGSLTVTIPAQATKLHLHVAGWSGENPTVTITAPTGVTVTPASITATADAGLSSNSPFTLQNDPVDQYLALSLSGNTEEIELTFSTDAGNKRFALYGVNQEGGVLPVLDHITITGTMTNTTGWKTGDNIVPEGLTVNAIYTLNNVEQTPVEVDPNDVVWSHAALVEDQTEVTLTATYTENEVIKSANVNVTIDAVETGAPAIITDPASYLNFGASVEQGAVVASKTITVTLKNIISATATLGGTNYSAFSIDDTEIIDGDVITVSVNTANAGVYAGTVTIKDDNSETQKVINLSMTVVAPEVPETPVSTTSKWVPATEIVDGMQVLIVGVKNEKVYAVGAQTSNNRTAVEGSLSEGVFTPGENTMRFTIVEQADGSYALQASNGKYLYAAGSGSGKNFLRSQDEVDDNAKWTLSVSSATAKGTNTNNKLQLNNSSDIFSCYSSTQKAIQFYVPQSVTPEPPTADYTRDGLTAGNYATICLPNSGTISGATLFDLEYFDEGASTLYLLEVIGNAMVAGRPYIFLPSATSIEVFYTDNENASAGSFNGLVGSYTKELVAIATGDEANYILWQNAYYLVNSTAYVGENRAYIHMKDVPTTPSTPQAGDAPRRRVAMTVNGAEEAQGIDNVGASDKPMKLMIDGQLFILRGEQMFDATGRLVK